MAMRIDEMDGMFVGLLTAEEIALLNAAIAEGRARRVYRGAGGLMGMAKVELVAQEPPEAK